VCATPQHLIGINFINKPLYKLHAVLTAFFSYIMVMVADPGFIRGSANEIASPYHYVVPLTGTLASIVLYTYYICEVGIPAIIIFDLS
jgi:hypothetical protein